LFAGCSSEREKAAEWYLWYWLKETLIFCTREKMAGRKKRPRRTNRSMKDEMKDGFWQRNPETNGTEHVPVHRSAFGPSKT
jgi:hypothetical protein